MQVRSWYEQWSTVDFPAVKHTHAAVHTGHVCRFRGGPSKCARCRVKTAPEVWGGLSELWAEVWVSTCTPTVHATSLWQLCFIVKVFTARACMCAYPVWSGFNDGCSPVPALVMNELLPNEIWRMLGSGRAELAPCTRRRFQHTAAMPSCLGLAFVVMRDRGQCVLCPDCLSILSLAGWLSMRLSSPRSVFWMLTRAVLVKGFLALQRQLHDSCSLLCSTVTVRWLSFTVKGTSCKMHPIMQKKTSFANACSFLGEAGLLVSYNG